MDQLLQPHTDAGVAAQVVLLVVVTALLAWRARRDHDVLRLVVAAGVLVAGLMVLRAAH